MENMDLAPFAKSIQANPCLWNPEHASYADSFAREAAWHKIVKKHHMADVAAAKKAWKALRDTHREVMKRIWINGGVHRHRPWRYFNHMAFLIPHMTAKPKGYSGDFNESKGSSDRSKRRKTRSASPRKEHSEEDAESVENDGVGIECKTELTELQSVSESIKDQSQESQDSFAYRARMPSISGAPEGEDALSKFFSAMCETVRSLPDIYQVEIKRKLFNAVADAEEHYLMSHK